MARSIFARLRGASRTTGVVGISFLAHGVALAHIDHAGGDQPRLLSCDVSSTDGPEERGAVLCGLAKAHELEGSPCVLTLEPGAYSLLQVDRPAVEDSELRAAVRWRIKDLLDFPVDEAVVDVFEVPGQERVGRTPSVYVVAARAEELRARVADIEEAGLKLTKIDIAELALRNIAAGAAHEQEAQSVLFLMPERGMIAVTRGETLYLARALDYGYEALGRSGAGDDDSGLSLVTDSKQELYDRVVLEVQRTMDFYDSHFGQAPIKQLLVVPGLPSLEELARYAGESLGLRASTLDPAAFLDMQIELEPEALAECVLAFGAALNKPEAVR